MKVRKGLRPSLWILLVAIALMLQLSVAARPGGGNSFSSGGSFGGGTFGGSSSSFGGGFGGGFRGGSSFIGGALGGRFGAEGLFLLALIGVVCLLLMTNQRKLRPPPPGWTLKLPDQPTQAPVADTAAIIRKDDANFSLVLLEDFLYALYAEVQRSRGADEKSNVSPYLSPDTRQALQVHSAAEVFNVVVGSMNILSLAADGDKIHLAVRFEANYTEATSEDNQRSVALFYGCEDWRLTRKRTTLSRPPEKVRVFQCPACGAPLSAIKGSTCERCNQRVDTGEFDWLVTRILVRSRVPQAPPLGGFAEEQGTDFPTIIAPNFEDSFRTLSLEKGVSLETFLRRAHEIFDKMQAAWSSQDWIQARPYLSDSFFQMQLYWIEIYKREGVRNVTERTRIVKVEPCKVTRDKFYDAITVRVHATGLDYTVDTGGQVIGGSKTTERQYTEYWTLIRGASATGAPQTDPLCPGCGAPLKISMAGSCEYCQAKVMTSDFDWVLSKIQQDEVYSG